MPFEKPQVDVALARTRTDDIWDGDILPSLSRYIEIPNESQSFDANWKANGHMDRAVQHIAEWCQARPIAGLTVRIVELPGKSPVIVMEIPATDDSGAEDTVLMYGHLDKQPPFTGWHEGLGPWTPVREGDKLYGRGGADDGYAAYASLTTIQLLKEQGVPHARIVILIESGEESGSPDLPDYVEHLRETIRNPSLIVCLDAGCGDYERFWKTSSLRGLVTGTLSVEMLTEGVHSGHGSGIIASPERIMRMLLDRVEHPQTGRVLVPCLEVKVPPHRIEEIKEVAVALGSEVYRHFPFVPGGLPIDPAPIGLLFNQTWKAALTVTAAEGFPVLGKAGNVVLPRLSYMLSMRIPPSGVTPEQAALAMKQIFETKPPYGAKVEFRIEKQSRGWDAPSTAPWLKAAIDKRAKQVFGKPSLAMGLGGSIPFMGMLGEKFPAAQFIITGVLGPGSNAHGPNEFLHVEYAKKLTLVVAGVIADHSARE